MSGIRKDDLLVSLYIFCIVASELMGSKVFTIGHVGSFELNASVAIFLFPLIFTINDVFVEVHGPERARSLARMGIVVVALSFLFAWLSIALPVAPRFASGEAAYDAVFGRSIRFSLASLTALTLAQFTDILVFSRLRQAFGPNALWLRNNVSNFAAQLIDTILFITLAYYIPGRSLADNGAFLMTIIVPYWLMKCFMSIVETPLVYRGVAWLKKA